MDDEKPVGQPEAEPRDTLDIALSELQKPEPTTPAEHSATEPAKPPADAAKPGEEAAKPPAAPGEAAKPGETAPAPAEPFKVGEEAKFKISDTAVKTREEIEKLPYANDASFKAIMGEFEQLAQFKIGMAEALNDGAYKIGDANQMKAVLADAFNLYDIANLKESPAALLDLMEKNFGTENITQVIAQVLMYAKEKGITIEQYSDLSKPENKRLFDLSKESRERKAKDAETQTTQRTAAEAKQREDDFNALEKHVTKGAKEAGVREADILDYITHIVSVIGGDAKQLEALRAGKMGEIDRIFTEYNNRQVDRQVEWEKEWLRRAQERQKKLQGAGAPAGGAPPPAEAPKKKLDFNDDDARMDAVKAGLRG